MNDLVDIKGLAPGAVLAALYNASRPQGMGLVRYVDAPMTEIEGTALLTEERYFDYLKGRVMKVEISGDTLDPLFYDRDNGAGAAARAIDALR